MFSQVMAERERAYGISNMAQIEINETKNRVQTTSQAKALTSQLFSEIRTLAQTSKSDYEISALESIAEKLLLLSDQLPLIESCMSDVELGNYVPSKDSKSIFTDSDDSANSTSND